MKPGRPIIGAAELVDLPEWGISNLRAKVDTGARSSALHVENVREVAPNRVTFDVRLSRKKHDRRVTVHATIVRRARVKPSSGHSELRLFVATTLRLGSVERRVELSLVSRERMIYRMLIGRTAMGHSFLVDPGRRYVLKQPKTSKKTARATRGRKPGSSSPVVG